MNLAPIAKRIWVTRPEAQAGYLTEYLNKEADTYTLPLLNISAAKDPSELNAALAQLAQFDLAVFISPSALNAVFAALNVPHGQPI